MPTRYSEDHEDIENLEAWAEVIKDVLWLVPIERRADVLALVTENEEAERKEREAHSGLRATPFSFDALEKNLAIATGMR